MWPIIAPECPINIFGDFRKVEVLYEFDVPMIFTYEGEQNRLFLAYLCAEDDVLKRFRYLTVPVSNQTIVELKNGSKTVFEALNQPWIWILETSYDGVLTTAWQIKDLTQIPDDAKPTKDAMLWPELMPFFSYRLIGEGLEKGRIPASVVARAIDGTTMAIKRLMLAVSATDIVQGRPEKWLKQLCDLPTQDFAYNSFEVSFRSGLDPIQSDMTGLDLDPYSEGQKKLISALEWLTKELHTEMDLIMLEVLSNLVPPSHGIVREVEIKGHLLGHSVVRLQRSHTAKVRKAISSVKQRSPILSTEGTIGEFDKDKLMFTLRQRPDNQPDISCVFEEGLYDDAWFAFCSDSNIKVIGRALPNRINTWEVTLIEVITSLEN